MALGERLALVQGAVGIYLDGLRHECDQTRSSNEHEL